MPPPVGGMPPLCRVCLLDAALDITDETVDTQSPFALPSPAEQGNFGHFVMEEEIGHGGMSIVYRARECESNRIVALKMLQLFLLRTPEMLRRFEIEVRAIANLDHPNIMPMYEVGQHEGIPYFSMKLAERGSLAKNMDAYRGKPRDTARLVAKLARAVFYAHQRGVIHRDLKPGNILLDANGEPYIADFGIAKFMNADGDDACHTTAIGTPNYLAPELVKGTSGEITLAADIYGLGAILYELLTGRPPAIGKTPLDVIDNLSKGPPPQPRTLNPAIPRDLGTLCMKCLAHNPAERYNSAADLADDLGNYLAGRPVMASPPNLAGQFWRFCRRQPVVTSLTAGIILLLATIAISSVRYAIDITAQRDRALHAEESAQNQLHNSLLMQMRLGRQTGKAGHRFDGLDVLRQAAAIRITDELRNEAAALLALTDIRVERTLEARPSQAYAIAFAPSLEYYAVCTASREVSLRSTADNSELARFPGTGQSIISLSEFSPDGRHTASRHYSGHIRVWDARERRLAFELENRTPRSRPYMSSRFWFGCAFSHDGKTAAIELPDGGYTLHDINDAGRETARLPLPRGPLALAFDSSDKRLAVSNRSTSTAEIRDTATGKVLHAFQHPARVISLAWEPDGSRLAVACLDTNIYLWNTATGECDRVLGGHRDRVHHVAYSPDGRLLASTSVDKTIILWDSERGTRLVTLAGHGDEPVLRFSNDGARLATGDFSATVSILEIATGDDICLTFTPPGNASMSVITAGVDFSPDSRWLVTSTREAVHLWNLQRNRLAAVLRPGPETETSALFTPDGRSMLVASRNTGLTSYPFDTNAADNPLGAPVKLMTEKGFTLSDFGSSAQHAILTHRSQGIALLWPLSPAAGKPRRIRVQTEAWDAALSADRKTLVTTCAAQGDRPDSKRLQLWNVETGTQITELEGGQGGLVRFSHDGKRIFSSSRGARGFHIWDFQSLEPVSTAPVFSGLFAYNLSADGRYLCVPVQRDIWLYQGVNYETPVIKLTPPGGPSQIPKMAFNHDGGLLAIHESDGVVHLWNLRNLRAALAKYNLDWGDPAQ
ncbi:WD40 repeat protein [Ereboglobus sp. PH5-10]|nr:protein kinase [Ereboglobus sp. PH5-10]MDF9827131.1 WD40 repeat protein [Ereboglobus sp. PH5-10]